MPDRPNHLITIDEETKTITEWAELYQISVPLIIGRLDRGWSEEKAVTKPPRKYGSNKDEQRERDSDG